MWRTIIETEQDYNFVWEDSSNQKSLMDSVGVDLKTLVLFYSVCYHLFPLPVHN